MELDVNFYWTAADTAAALISAGGAMIALTADRIYRRLVGIMSSRGGAR